MTERLPPVSGRPVDDIAAGTIARARRLPPVRDRTLLLLRRGYLAVPDLRASGREAISEVRLLGRRTVCVAGRDAVELFYDESKLQRADATPRPLSRTLFGDGAVHGLDGENHRQRKAMFLSLLAPPAAMRLTDITAEHWEKAASRWIASDRPVVVFDEAVDVLGASACAWAGIPAERVPPGLPRQLATIVDGIGSVGARHLRARAARSGANRWATGLVAAVRGGSLEPPDDAPLHVVSNHRDRHGRLLDAKVAGVELLNLLRPTVAVAWFVTFTALALYHHLEWRDRIRSDAPDTLDSATLEVFALEIRRFYPFAPVLGARARVPFAWRGHRVAPGQLVVLDVYGTLHDPPTWRDPDHFDPDRFAGCPPDPYTYIPHGGGEATGHRCPGEHVTLELVKQAAWLLAHLDYDVPAQDLHTPLTRVPTRPASGFVIRDVTRADQDDRES